MSDITTKIERPQSVSELVLNRLRDDIIHNHFKFGEKISETQIAKIYGVTKAPIRSAYIRLDGEGMIVIKPQAGTYVFNPTLTEIRALCELRTAIEVEALKLAYERNRKNLLARWQSIYLKMEDAIHNDDHVRYQNLDAQYHMALLQSAESSLLEQTYVSQVASRISALRFRFSGIEHHQTKSLSDHKAILTSLKNNERKETIELLRLHIGYRETYYSQILENHDDNVGHK